MDELEAVEPPLLLDGRTMQLVQRRGERPRTSSDGGPHRQLSQLASPELWGLLVHGAFSLDGVREGHSVVSLATSRALLLDTADANGPDAANGPDEAFLSRPEFAHVHDVFDTSLHACLPQARAMEVCMLGWGEPHGHAERLTEVMLYAPRDEDELEVVLALLAESRDFARG
jgi:hypothetical protein